MNKKIVMLAGAGESTKLLFHALQQEFNIEAVIIEKPVDKKTFLKNRAKKLGWPKVLGQVIFQAVVVPLLKRMSGKRLLEIYQKYAFVNREIDANKLMKVESVNDAACLDILRKLQPAVVIVNGTRIISKKVLEGIDAVFINTHAGITPKYRGVHGTYWALVNNDTDNCGVTIHLVDKGIDTGGVLYQALVQPTAKDNFITYPLLQLGTGIPLMKQAIADASNDKIAPVPARTKESALWYHPTVFEYLWYRFRKGIK
jgi:methionyl-tRNA formyltransferase